MADKLVSALTDIDALADADSFPVRDATDTAELKEVTAAQIATYVDAAGAASSAISTHEAAANPHPTYLTAAEGDAAYQPLDADLTSIAAANNGTVLAATTASFTTADETKLDGIATGATDDTTVDAHIADTSSAHAVTSIGASVASIIAGRVTAGAGDLEELSATQVRTLLNVADGATDDTTVDAHIADASGAHAASAVSFTPASGIAATDAQAAIVEAKTDAQTYADAAVSTHTSDTTSVHGIADTSALYAAGGTDVAVTDGGTGSSTAAGARTNLGLVIGTDVQAHSAVLDATTASFTTADESKLDGIEAAADVTDAANVETAIEAITFTPVSGATGDEVMIVDATDGGLKAVLWENLPGAGGGLSNVVEDTTPQLGGQLDVNGQAIGDGTRELVTFVEDASAVNHVEIENQATGGGPIIRAAGDDTNVDLNLAGKGSGVVAISGAVTVSSTVDGRDLAADGTKLDGIAAGATDDTTVDAHIADTDNAHAVTSIGASAADIIAGRVTAGAGDLEELTATQVRTLLNVEDGADVTDATNVTAAGALMDSEVSSLSGIKTLTVPDSTTISAFGATLTDDIDAATARTTLGVDAAGTDNSTDVTLAGTPDYITISGQTITRNAVDLAADITGTLPLGNGGTGGTTAQAAAANLRVAPATVTGTTDTLAAADDATTILYTAAGAVTVTLADIATGFEAVLVSLGAGGLSVAAGGMSFANSFTPKLTVAQGEALFVKQTAASTWIVVGGTAT